VVSLVEANGIALHQYFVVVRCLFSLCLLFVCCLFSICFLFSICCTTNNITTMIMSLDDFNYAYHQLYVDQPTRFVMSHFKIIKSKLPVIKTRHKYLYQEGRMDYLGQIITQMGFNVSGKHRFPSDLGKHIPPFTQECRGVIIDSILTLQVLELDYLSPQIHEQRLREIFPNWTFSFVP